jgi:hypothetical protein
MKLRDKPLKIEGQACGKRIVDSLYKAGDQYYFLDTGWVYASFHPYHCIGKLVDYDQGEWLFEDEEDRLFAVSVIDNKEDLEFYKGWKTYLKEKYPDLKGIDVAERNRGEYNIPANVKIEQVSI